MKIEQSSYGSEQGWHHPVSDFPAREAGLVFVMGSRELLKMSQHFHYIQQRYPRARIVGCSTSGEIMGKVVTNDRIVCTAVWFENTSIEIASAEINSANDSFEVGAQLVDRLMRIDLVHVMVFSEGININGSELTRGLNSRLTDKIAVTGGLAGDQELFTETVLIDNAPGRKNLVIAVGFYGRHLRVGYGSMGGWDSFGIDRRITRSEANILYELDDQPALALYKHYLGSYSVKLPSSALLFPLNLVQHDNETSLVRTVVSVSEEDGSMVFAGDLPQGDSVRLMKTNSNKLIGGARDAAKMSAEGLRSTPELAILISCVGRKMVLRQRVGEEVETVRQVVGENTAITGFYSYGEICPVKPFDNHCELHNQTMTITVFKEEHDPIV